MQHSRQAINETADLSVRHQVRRLLSTDIEVSGAFVPRLLCIPRLAFLETLKIFRRSRMRSDSQGLKHREMLNENISKFRLRSQEICDTGEALDHLLLFRNY